MAVFLLMSFSSAYTGTRYLSVAFLWYVIAKLTEFCDEGIYIFSLHILSVGTLLSIWQQH